MAGRKAEMEQRKAIERQRDRLLVEIEALRNKVAGLELALSLIGAVANSSEEQERPKENRGLRQTLADLLREAGTTGLNATSAVEIAQRRGIHFDRQSVASTLSRMKKDGEVIYNGDRYKLTQFASPSEAASADVVPLRA